MFAMKKTTYILCIMLFSTIFLYSHYTNQAIPIDSIPDLEKNQVDTTAPEIYFNLKNMSTTGEITGVIIDLDSDLSDVNVTLNGDPTKITGSYVNFTSAADIFKLRCSFDIRFSSTTGNGYEWNTTTDEFTTGLESNVIEVNATNGDGLGGSSNCWFCEDIHCWGPLPLMVDNNQDKLIKQNSGTDMYAPHIDFYTKYLICCGAVDTSVTIKQSDFILEHDTYKRERFESNVTVEAVCTNTTKSYTAKAVLLFRPVKSYVTPFQTSPIILSFLTIATIIVLLRRKKDR
jgi:hypothetical protein